jgi:hypothetical protein
VSRHLGASRRTLFDATDRSALKPLPTAPYVYAEWKQCKAGLDYHVEVEKHYYSVPHALLRETLGRGSPRGPSSFSIKAIASPSMCARHPTGATRP